MKNIKTLEKEVLDFNIKYKMGDPVKVQLDSGELRESTIKHEAEILGGHTAVGWFTGISGCYRLDKVV
jgi:hypothetical protein